MSLITKSVYLRGPKGERGLQGLKGERGLTGAQGLPGPAGESDPQFIRNQFSATGNITYNQATGVIGFTNPGYATTTYVDTAISNLVSGAPDLLNTLNELAAAIGNNANFINSVIVKTGGTMTGALILDADPITNLGAATKQYVDQATSSIVTSYNDLTDKPTLFSGSYTDLTSKPTLFDGAYSSLSGKPSLATVATSGSYNDLTNKPIVSSFDQSLNTTNNVTFNSITATSIDVENLEFTGTGPIVISSGNDLKFTSAGDITFNGSKLSTVAISGSYTDLTSKPTLFSGSYTDLTSKPTLFSGSYTDLTNKPTIPSDINQLTDDDGLLNSGSGSGASDWSDISFDGGTNFESMGSDPDNYGSSELVIDAGEFVFDGNYNNLTNKPTLFSGSYTDLTSKPILFDGDYNSLTNKPTVNYAQTIGNPVAVPYGSSLPFTIISATITTTGNPVRIHISGDCYSNTGGNPKIQIYRDTTGLGRRMTITNSGSAIPYAIEVIDPVGSGTYTYSLKISSGSISNGTFFGADDGNVLTITELK